MTLTEINTSRTMEQITNTAALGAVTSPAWLPFLKTTSDVAGLLLPILGAAWLLVQIVVKVREHRARVDMEKNNG